jgi:hypothetical protein
MKTKRPFFNPFGRHRHDAEWYLLRLACKINVVAFSRNSVLSGPLFSTLFRKALRLKTVRSLLEFCSPMEAALRNTTYLTAHIAACALTNPELTF